MQFDERGPSPEPPLIVTSSQETLGPNEEEDAEFAKELAKLVTDVSTESRRVDRRTAQTLWESAVLPPGMRKRHEEGDGSPESANPGVMNFTMLTKRGNRQQVRQLAIPSASALAVQTRSAQEQDKVEQQHLKRLVLDYEQREEAEEIKGGSNNSLSEDAKYEHLLSPRSKGPSYQDSSRRVAPILIP